MGTGQRVGYQRVSTLVQTQERQLDGIQLDKVFTEHASGKDTVRPQLRAMLDYVREGDRVLVHSVDRLGRNVRDLIGLVEEMTGKGVAVEFVKQGLVFDNDTANPMNQLMFTMLAAFAEFERALMLERQAEGIAIAKAAGKYKGRKPSLTPEQATAVATRLDGGESASALAREYGISRATIYNTARRAA
jgi:DNA invertase Pin-like site-specific DNA recombinase